MFFKVYGKMMFLFKEKLAIVMEISTMVKWIKIIDKVMEYIHTITIILFIKVIGKMGKNLMKERSVITMEINMKGQWDKTVGKEKIVNILGRLDNT